MARIFFIDKQLEESTKYIENITTIWIRNKNGLLESYAMMWCDQSHRTLPRLKRISKSPSSLCNIPKPLLQQKLARRWENSIGNSQKIDINDPHQVIHQHQTDNIFTPNRISLTEKMEKYHVQTICNCSIFISKYV